MGYTSDYLRRADIRQLRGFLLYGTENRQTDEGSCEERIRAARHRLDEWLRAACPEAERERLALLIDSYALELENVYMELGLRAGIRLMAQAL